MRRSYRSHHTERCTVLLVWCFFIHDEDAPHSRALHSFHYLLDATERNVVVIHERDDDGTQTVVVVLCVGIAIAIASVVVGV